MPEMQKITVTAPVLIEVAAPVAAGPQIAVREVEGGVVLDVPREVKAQLIQFGWMPPLDTMAGE